MPREVAVRKKLGFPVPIRVWLRQEKYYNLVLEMFKSDISVEFFNQFDIYIKMSFPNDAIYTVESVQDELIKIMNKAKNKMME